MVILKLGKMINYFQKIDQELCKNLFYYIFYSNTLKNIYPVQKIIKTERKINQSHVKNIYIYILQVRKENNLTGMKLELMIKNNYVMTYDDFFEYYQNDNSKKDIDKTWESLSDMKEPEKYYVFLNKTFPLFM